MREEPTIEWTCRFSFRHRTSEPITVVGSSDAVLCKTPLVRLDKSSLLSGRYLRRRYNNAGMVAIRIRNGAIFPLSRKSRNGECINSTVVLIRPRGRHALTLPHCTALPSVFSIPSPTEEGGTRSPSPPMQIALRILYISESNLGELCQNRNSSLASLFPSAGRKIRVKIAASLPSAVATRYSSPPEIEEEGHVGGSHGNQNASLPIPRSPPPRRPLFLPSSSPRK